jgi:hypothetical protein
MKKTILYYSFDWDDNILNMPTEIIVESDKGEEIGISTQDFAKYRSIIGKENFNYNGHTIIGFPTNNDGSINYDSAFKNFRDFGDKNIFLEDTKKALKSNSYAPAWVDFIECLVNGSLFSIITARGHESNTIREAIEFIINNELDKNQKYEMYNNLLHFAYIFKSGDYDRLYKGDFTKNKLVKDYLDNCDYIGVSAPSRSGKAENPEEAKKMALIQFKDKINEFAKRVDAKAKIGFSDDDPKNAKHIEELFKNLNHEKYSHIIHYVVKDTNDPKNIKKMERTIEKKVLSYDKFLESSEKDQGMYIDTETEKKVTDENKKSSTLIIMGEKTKKKKEKNAKQTS